jgi:hypothetical protein
MKWIFMTHFKPAVERLLQPATEQRLVSGLFLRLLALIYLAAFASLPVQITGLVGETDILPLSEHFNLAAEQYGKGMALVSIHFLGYRHLVCPSTAGITTQDGGYFDPLQRAGDHHIVSVSAA